MEDNSHPILDSRIQPSCQILDELDDLEHFIVRLLDFSGRLREKEGHDPVDVYVIGHTTSLFSSCLNILFNCDPRRIEEDTPFICEVFKGRERQCTEDRYPKMDNAWKSKIKFKFGQYRDYLPDNHSMELDFVEIKD
ncbi:MAG: hypothetical protein ABJV68_05505 [Paracoccaceae bacterium]